MLVTFVIIRLEWGIKKSNKEITEISDIRLAPLGPAFAIWGIIYMLMGAFTVY